MKIDLKLNKCEKIKTACRYLKIALIFAVILLALLDLLSVIDMAPFRGVFAFIAAVVIIEIILSWFSDDRFGAAVRFFKRLIAITAVLELTVFNFGSYHLLFGDYQEQTLSLNSTYTSNFDVNSGRNLGTGRSVIEFSSVGYPIGTISVDAESDKSSVVEFSVDISDDSHSADYRNNIASVSVIKDDEGSKTAVCNFSGNVRIMRLSFSSESGETVTVKSIRVNKPVDFHFSPVRFLMIILICAAVYMLTVSGIFKRSFEDNKRIVKNVAYAFTAVLILVALMLTNAGRYKDENHSIDADFSLTTGNQMTKGLVDAFEAGHTYLDIPMNVQLLSLENPYDRSLREAENIGSYPWDHLLYEGKYYSYYGIAPVVTLFLPYHLITGYYFPSSWAVWIFGCLGIYFLTKLYLAFMYKFFKNVRSSLILMGLFIMQLISGIWFCFNTANFYEIAQTSGFACVTAGAYFLISSNVIGDGKISNTRVALSSVFLSLGVLCRPTLAVYCIAALIFIAAGVLKLKENKSAKKTAAKTYLPYLACALLPFAVIGSVQMIYNFVRFGSVFDFGIQYSLTINDFTTAQYHTHFVLIGLFNYLFAMPKFSPSFPFFDFSTVEKFNPQGYYFIATASALGILWKAAPVLAYAKSAKAYRLTERKNRRLYAAMVFAVCIAAPFIIMFSIWESGYGARYCVDFFWQMLLGALIIAFVIYQKCKDDTKNRLNTLMVISALICLVLCFGQIYNWVVSNMSVDWQAQALSFGRLFEFLR